MNQKPHKSTNQDRNINGIIKGIKFPENAIVLTTDEMHRQLFLRAYSWDSWVTSAYFLWKSAKVLWDIYVSEERRALSLGDKGIGQNFDIEHQFTAYMLMGMSLEALLKGCLIVKDPSLIENDALKPEILKHDLLQLLLKAKIKLSQSEKLFCNTLTEYIIWSGRYPIPKGVSKVPDTLFFVNNGWQIFNDLFYRILTSVPHEEIDKAKELFRSKEDEFYKDVNKSHDNIK